MHTFQWRSSGQRSFLSSPCPAGQATVELALVLPLLAVFVMLIAQFAMVATHQLALWQVARDATRVASLSSEPRDAVRVVIGHNTIAGAEAIIEDVSQSDAKTRVRLKYRERTSLPLLGAFLPDLTLYAEVVMATEPAGNVSTCNSVQAPNSATTC